MRRLLTVTVAVAVTVAPLSGCGVLQLQQLPAPSGVHGPVYKIRAEFADVGNLTVGAKVKRDGVVVGEVSNITTREYRAVVAMRISKDARLPTTSAFEVRFSTPLGENFIAVSAPSSAGGAVLADGALVPMSRTAQAPTIEDTFAAVSLLLNGGGLDKVHTIVAELDRAMTGRTGEVRDALVQLRDLTKHLNQHSVQLDKALTGLHDVAASVNRQTPLVEQALRVFPDTLQTLADDTAKLRVLVVKVATLGDTVQSALNRGQRAMLADLDALRPTLDALRSADDQLLPTFASLQRFGRLISDAAPGDYLNLNIDIQFLFDVPPQRPRPVTPSQTPSDAVRTLLVGGLR